MIIQKIDIEEIYNSSENIQDVIETNWNTLIKDNLNIVQGVENKIYIKKFHKLLTFSEHIKRNLKNFFNIRTIMVIMIN